MPYIDAKLSIKLDELKKDKLQKELTGAVSSAFSKPKSYIMANIEDAKSLYMSEEKIEEGAYIAVSALGTVSKQACQSATKEICDVLKNNYGIDGAHIYVTYHSVELWGWNGSMF